MARNNYRILPLALLNRDYCRHYHASVLQSHSRKVVNGATTEYYFCGQLHRPEKEGPAIDSEELQVYYRHGRMYRSKGPTKISIQLCPGESTIKDELWFRKGYCYKMKTYIDNMISSLYYYNSSFELHHPIKPAFNSYYNNTIIEQVWYRHGSVHRDTPGPYRISYNSDGSISETNQ